MDKYDRQIRLWNVSGQNALANSSICLININTVATEILKNIVLSGIASITIVDSNLITENDLATNFFFTEQDLGFSKSEVLSKNLSILNPDVSISYINNHSTVDLINDNNFWNQFNCIIYTPLSSIDNIHDDNTNNNINIDISFLLSDLLWNLNIPLLRISSLGFYAYLQIQYNEQSIIDTHENNLHDLRLDSPWPELKAFIDSIDLNPELNDLYYQIPYSIILTKIFQSLKSNNSINPIKPNDIRNQIKLLYQSGDEINLNEAYNKAYLILKNSYDISNDLLQILNNENAKSSNLNNKSSIFWILINALNQFYNEFGLLPLSGSLPDMESNTTIYIKLQKLYADKFNNDKDYIKFKVLESLKKLNRSFNELSDSLLTTFVKNSKFLKFIKGSKWNSTTQILQYFEKLINDSTSDSNSTINSEALIYLSFMIIESYVQQNGNYPTPQNKSELRTLAISILCNDDNLKSFPDGLDKVLDEMCRSNGKELHNISAFLGGIAAQETIKILTNQYVTLDNSLVVDGINGKTSTFKLT
jgi:amyloid beta precursor protein binding protein 1